MDKLTAVVHLSESHSSFILKMVVTGLLLQLVSIEFHFTRMTTVCCNH